jgi:hypothetical protein
MLASKPVSSFSPFLRKVDIEAAKKSLFAGPVWLLAAAIRKYALAKGPTAARRPLTGQKRAAAALERRLRSNFGQQLVFGEL